MRFHRWWSFESVGALVLVAATGCTSTGAMIDLDFTLTASSVDAGSSARLHIAADGTTAVMREGDPDEAFVLPAAMMADLRDKIDAADFASLHDHYESMAFVDFIYLTTVRFENGSYTVMSNDSSDAPDALQRLDEALTGIASN